METRRPFLHYAIVTVPLFVGLGFLSGQLSDSGSGNDWFDTLAKPSFMPPGWLFGVAWTILYILLGFALALILSSHGPARTAAVLLFGMQMAMNFAWSPVFFGGGEIIWALAIIVTMLLLSIAATLLFFRINKAAGLMMLPYLAWLSFAALLNYEIMALNPAEAGLAAAPPSADIGA
jgi:translocator protein